MEATVQLYERRSRGDREVDRPDRSRPAHIHIPAPSARRASVRRHTHAAHPHQQHLARVRGDTLPPLRHTANEPEEVRLLCRSRPAKLWLQISACHTCSCGPRLRNAIRALVWSAIPHGNVDAASTQRPALRRQSKMRKCFQFFGLAAASISFNFATSDSRVTMRAWSLACELSVSRPSVSTLRPTIPAACHTFWFIQ